MSDKFDFSQLPDEAIEALAMANPWQFDPDSVEGKRDEDGFSYGYDDRRINTLSISKLQEACWNSFNTSPQIQTSVIDRMGRVCGDGFETTSENYDIAQYVLKIETDPRNRLYTYWPMYFARGDIEGELFQCLTIHEDGFVEIDFIDPSSVQKVLRHPSKPQMPLLYRCSTKDSEGKITSDLIYPSINLAFYPEMWEEAKKIDGYDPNLLTNMTTSNKKFKKLKGYRRFIIAWERGFLTDRNVSHLRTVLKWVNYYENLKQYEIDHKKAAASYLWIFKMEDVKAFRLWLGLSDEERKKTGMAAKLVPGGRMFLPPGITVECVSPKLPNISDADTDIMEMVVSGLNETKNMATGSSKGTFASEKASRGPQSDRISDLAVYFSRFLRYEFWRSIFFLAQSVGALPESYKVREAYDYKGKKPKFKDVDRQPHELLEISFPTSAISEIESMARAFLGVKHGSLNTTLGISNATLARKLGFGNYKRERLRFETEVDRYPELMPDVDQEAQQEITQGEPAKKKPKIKKTTKPAKPEETDD